MSWGAENFVRSTKLAPGGSKASALSDAETRVMLFVAHVYQDERGCAWRSMASIAADVDKSEGYTRRLIAGLVGKGRLRRHAVLRGSDESQTSNEYEIVGYSPAVDEAARRKADARLYVKPQRSIDQAMVRRGGRQRKQQQLAFVELGEAEAVDAFVDSREAEGSGQEPAFVDLCDAGGADLFAEVRGGFVAGERSLLGDVSRAGESQAGSTFVDVRGGFSETVEKGLACLPGANLRGLGGANLRCLPIESLNDLQIEEVLPLPHRANVENLPDIAKARASATASARATATTPALGAVKPYAESEGGSGMRSGRARRMRGARVLDALGNDGADAALRLEVERVLLECGWTPGALAGVIAIALRTYAKSKGCSLAAAGDLAVQRWHAYCEEGPYLRYMVQPRKFIERGVWLAPKTWPVDSRLRPWRHPDARIGMWRG
jgi:hypothetical protein